MKTKTKISVIVMSLLVTGIVASYAISVPFLVGYSQERKNEVPPQDDPRRQRPTAPHNNNANGQQDDKDKKTDVIAQPILENEDTIPDSLLHPRWKIQRTIPVTYDDLLQLPVDLKRPDNLKQEVQYNDTLDSYLFGNKMGSTWLNAPISMSADEYLKWSNKQNMLNNQTFYFPILCFSFTYFLMLFH